MTGRGKRLARGSILTLRQRIYDLLDEENQSHSARRMRAVEMALILAGIAAVSLGTVDSISLLWRDTVEVLTGVVAVLFLLEYLIRVWVAPEHPHSREIAAERARVRWVFSAPGIVDLVAVVPALTLVFGAATLGADSAAIFVLLWVMKLATHAPGVELIARVVRNERTALTAVMILFVITLLSAATLAHFAEGTTQPDDFGSIPSSLWWAIVTLTTTGYGDVVPKTPLGRMLGGALMICGIGVLALLAGILATGFSEEVKRREFVRVWELVAKVPFFSDVGAVAISDIVARLRSRNYPANAVVVRRGGPGDAMYFIVSGEVEVRIGTTPIVLRDGAFFGEMALLDRRPRSADIITATPCTLLVLNVADFYQIAGQQPSLIQAIEDEAKRRHAANVAAKQT
jgi:voltage-gated potassium channel